MANSTDKTILGDTAGQDSNFLAQEQFNQTESRFPFIPVSERIHSQAVQNPDKVAVISSGRKMTYGELDLEASRVAAFLRQKLAPARQAAGENPCKDIVVGVLLERTEYAYVVEHGILKAGAAFLPFVTSYPDERINFCLEDAQAPLLIMSAASKEARQDLAGGYEIVTLEELLAAACAPQTKLPLPCMLRI